MPKVEVDNPFVKDKSIKLKWIGDSYFHQTRQVRVPMVVTEFQDGYFKTLFIGTVE
jgi:branched-chain amino acid transport system substrate-binding protein